MSAIKISLPDGSFRSYEKPITVSQVAQDIGPRLAASMVAAKLDGKIYDYNHKIVCSCALQILTSQDSESLDILRHSTAHLMAQAVKLIFPSVQITVGPVTADGFYYDFYYPTGFKEQDLEKIENKMHELVKAKLPITRSVMHRADASKFFSANGEHYKAKIIDELIDADEVSIYSQGEFVDLCRGPHVPNTSFLGAFKLTKLSGAYWRGNQSNEMLQRIYGTAWASKQELDQHLARLELAKTRDHRSLGVKLDWFHLQEEAPGMVFWHHKGWQVIQAMKQYQRMCLKSWGYKEINTPQILDKALWEASGHWDKYSENMFVIEAQSREMAVKPMSCPGHVEMFKHGLKSYRDLPIRFAEFGCCHRNEPSGTLHGLMRVRGFVQDDGHIFCHMNHVGSEIASFVKQVGEVYKKYGFKNFSVCLSTRPAKRVGSDEQWDISESMLESALNEVLGQDGWTLSPGEGAFYGPKVEFTLHDCMGRSWQCGTIQLDFETPRRLGAAFIDQDNTKQCPVMLHRAILGSLERFLGILIEENDGRLPLWLMPVQVVVLAISDELASYCQEIHNYLQDKGYRVDIDLRSEKIGYKIREHSQQRVPYLVICGQKEHEGNVISVRDQYGKDLGQMQIEQFIKLIEGDSHR